MTRNPNQEANLIATASLLGYILEFVLAVCNE